MYDSWHASVVVVLFCNAKLKTCY